MKLLLPVKFALFSFIITLCGVVSVALMAASESKLLFKKHVVNGFYLRMEKELFVLEQQAEVIKKDIMLLSKSKAVRALVHRLPGLELGGGPEKEAVERLFASLLHANNMYFQVRFIGLADHGREVVRVADFKQGIVRVASVDLQQKDKHDYFKKSIALKAGRILFSDITLNRENDQIALPPSPMLRVSTPVFDDGKLHGVLVINVKFDVFTAMLQNQFQIGYNAPDFFITNEQGDYLIHPDDEKAMAFEYQRQQKMQMDYPLLNKAKQSASKTQSSEINEYLFDDHDEVLLLAKVHFDHEYADRFIQLGAVIDLTAINAQSQKQRNHMLLLTVLLALFLGLITYYMTKYFTRSIRAMIDAAVKIGEGHEDVSIPANTHDEIGVLGEALQRMVVHLGETRRKTDALNAVLEVKVSKRTAQLARLAAALESQNSELERAVLDAEKAAVVKGQFLATMSHEIRTPLNGVLGLTELLLETELTTSQRENLKTVKASADALLAILNDILDFSKIEAGLMEIHLDEFNPNLIIEHVAKLFSGRVNVDEEKLELIARTIPILGHLVIGDAGRLQQVMMNLLSNAVKFTSQGDITISADLISESNQFVRIRFEVRDTGKGISEADQSTLFDEFTQADGTDTRKHGGTGLGLAIVKNLVTLMGGSVCLESTVGKGSRFYFELDLDKASEAPDRPQDYAAYFGHWRALVVDDNATNQGMLKGVLTAWGMRCDASSYGNAALQTLQAMGAAGTLYDVVIIDQQMRGMDGMCLAKLIKEDGRLSNMKVIMTTSLDMIFDDALREEYGLDGFIRKPIYMHSLFETMLSVMDVKPRQGKQRQLTFVVQREERILLAEDNTVNQQVAVGMLKNQGFVHVDVANNGVEAIEYFTENDYALILMDIQMPELDGLCATREIREVEQISEQAPVPIIAVTAHALEEDKQRTREAGMNDHLTKPLTGKSLGLMLNNWLPLNTDREQELDLPLAASASNGQAVDSIVNDSAKLEEASVMVLDEAGLRQLRSDLGFGIGMILDTYIEELPKQVESVIAAVEAGDSETLRRDGHRLKGASRSVMANSFGELCFEYERLGQSGDPDDLLIAKEKLDDFQRLAQQVIDALSASWLDDIR